MAGLLFVHIGSRIHMYQESDAGNDQQENSRKLVDL